MNAKEYFKHEWGLNDMDMFSDIFSGIDMAEFAKDYHQAKSKEEAEERMEKVEAWWEANVEGEMNITVQKVLRIASGKEEG